MIRNTRKLVKAVMMTAMTIGAGGSVFQGCGTDMGMGDYYGGYGYYDPTDTIMSVNDYRSSVYESSNDAWDAYIRQ